MDQKRSSGLLGFLGLIACAALYFSARRFFPALSTLLLWVFGIAAALIVVLVAVVLFAAFHKPKKTPEQEKLDMQNYDLIFCSSYYYFPLLASSGYKLA